MTKFLKDGAPYDPRAARQQAGKVAAKRPQPQNNPLPVKKAIPPPGQHRRAPAAATEAYDRIMEQRARQEGFRQAGQGGRFIPEADSPQLDIPPPMPNQQRPQQGQQQRPPVQGTVQSRVNGKNRTMAITPMQQGQTAIPQPQRPQAMVPPTEMVRPVESSDGFELDERFQEVYLPSKFLPYPFKRIYVRQFERSEIKAIIRAKASGSYRHLLQAIGQTINVDPEVLTLGDFWYLMYWHRINSYKKTPFIVTWDCKDEKHLHRIKLPENDGQRLHADTVHNQLTINKSNLKEVGIDQEKYLAVANRIFEEHKLQVTPQTVGDFADMMEEEEEDQLKRQAKEHKLGQVNVEDEDQLMNILYELQEEVADVEVRMYGFRHAAVISKVHGETLADRDQFLDSFPPEIESDLEEFIAAADHGVVESFNVKCEGCGASKEIKSSLDALSFLPSYHVGSAA